jgi:hypothetical protein
VPYRVRRLQYTDAGYIDTDTFDGHLIGKGSASESYGKKDFIPSALLAHLEESERGGLRLPVMEESRKQAFLTQTSACWKLFCTKDRCLCATVFNTLAVPKTSVAQTVVHDHTAFSCSWANVTAATRPKSRLFADVTECISCTSAAIPCPTSLALSVETQILVGGCDGAIQGRGEFDHLTSRSRTDPDGYPLM